MMSTPEPSTLAGRLAEAARLAADRRDDAHALALLADVARVADALGVVSANDALREISTHSLRVFFVPSLQARLEDARPTGGAADAAARMQQRRAQVEASLGAARLFFATTARHGALPRAVALMLRPQVAGDAPLAPAERRHLKIQLLKLEKQVERLLDAFRTAYRAQKRPAAGAPPADVFYDLLVVPGVDDDDDDDDDDDVAPDAQDTYEARAPRTLRDYLLMLLVLHAVRTAHLMDAAHQELELLRTAPPPADAAAAEAPRADDAWRLDSGWFSGARGGALLDTQGKPLRPFVITGSAGGATRDELKAQVFRPSHRLPTMSIDEYLAEEERRGNIVRSGGAAQAAAPTPREQRAETAELDGTRAAEDAEEAARQDAIRWDAYTDAHKRGAGNTMNRG